MKKILLTFVLMISLFLASGSIAYAASDFEVNFHVPSGQPIFNISNMKPGDQTQRTIDVKNKSDASKTSRIKGVKTGGVGDNLKIEHVLSLTIKEGNTILYGPATVEQFLTDSNNPSGIELSSISKNKTKTYKILVVFPVSAGNEYQGKSVNFDVLIDDFVVQKVVINEVFYHVDQSHWHGFTQDRRDDDHDLDDGGWYRDWFWQSRWWVFKKDFQWIELYNPTDSEISLKNWSLVDKDNRPVFIHSNSKIKAHGFALLAKDNSPWRYWNLPRGTQVIELGGHIGNGLDPRGDHLILRNPSSGEIDTMSWGTDTSGFTPPAINPLVPRGSSTARVSDGVDTDTANDWREKRPPSPGR